MKQRPGPKSCTQSAPERTRISPIPLLDLTGPGKDIEIFKVADTGITALCRRGIVNKTGGQIGACTARYYPEHYIKAACAFLEKDGA